LYSTFKKKIFKGIYSAVVQSMARVPRDDAIARHYIFVMVQSLVLVNSAINFIKEKKISTKYFESGAYELICNMILLQQNS